MPAWVHERSPARLSSAEVSAAGLAGWRQLIGRLHARYRTGDFAPGLTNRDLDLARQISEIAAELEIEADTA